MMKEREDKLFFSKIEDLWRLSQKRPCFSAFLNENEAAGAEDFLKGKKGASFLFWGGYEEAKRKLLGVFPDYLEADLSLFPLEPLSFTYREEDELSHRDFLGSFMALGVERSTVGDILPGKGHCVAFVKKEMADYFCQNIRKIGRTGVRIESGIIGELPCEQKFLEYRGTVASKRLDCLVAFFCRTSREKAAELIASKAVSRNHREALSGAQQTEEGDVLSIRGKGRFLIDRFGSLTQKGRIQVEGRKYQ